MLKYMIKTLSWKRTKATNQLTLRPGGLAGSVRHLPRVIESRRERSGDGSVGRGLVTGFSSQYWGWQTSSSSGLTGQLIKEA